MKTYMEIRQETTSEYVTDGKTKNQELNKILPILYKKFSIFEIRATLDSDNVGFRLKIMSQDDFQRRAFGVISVKYDLYTYDGFPRKYYCISCHREKSYHEESVGTGYGATGDDFEQVLTAFFMGIQKLLKERIKIYQKYVDKIGSKHPGKYYKDNANFHPIEYC